MPDTTPSPGSIDSAAFTYKGVLSFLQDAGVPPPFRQAIAGFIASLVLLGSALLGLLVGGVRYVGIPFAIAVLQIINTVRKANLEGFDQLATEAVSEMLGVDLTPASMTPGRSSATVLQQMDNLGQQVHKVLNQEFTGSTPITPEEGVRNAARFTGFSMNTASTSTLIGLLGEMTTLGIVKDIDHLGGQLAGNLGLGRLHRQAIGPLVRATIAQPLDRYMRQKYRPDLLADVQYVRAYWAGRLTLTALQQRLAQKGYTDEDIQELLLQLAPDDNQVDIVRLTRYGELSTDEAVQLLRNQGWPEDYAKRRLTSALLARVDSTVDTIISEQRAKVLDGFLSLDDFRALLQSLPLLDVEQKWLMRDLGLRLETPRSKPTWAQVQTWYIDGIVDFSYVDQWLTNEGYSPDDTLNYELELLKKFDDKATKAAAAAAKAAAKTKPAGTTTIKAS